MPPGREPVTGGGGKVDGGITRGTLEGRTGAGTVATGGGGGKGVLLPKLAVNLNEEKLRLAGLDKTAVARQLDSSLEGTVGGSILEGTKELPVRVRTSNSQRSNLAEISSLNLLSSGNSATSSTIVPLSTVGTVEILPDIVAISRRNGQRMNTIQGFIPAGVLPEQVLSEFEKRLEMSNFQLPYGYCLFFKIQYYP